MEKKWNPIIYSSENSRGKQPVGKFMVPLAFHHMEIFEQMNKVRVNVFRHSKKKLIHVRISINQNFRFKLDLLLLNTELKHQYVLITNIKALIHQYLGNHHRPKLESFVMKLLPHQHIIR